MKSWRIVTILLLCLALASSMACNPFGGDKEEAGQQLVEVVRGDLIVTVNGSGNIDVSNEAKLSFDVGGKVVEIRVKEGDWVTKGQQIARLDDADYQLAVKLAEVDFETAQSQLQLAEVDFEAAQKQLNVARVEVEIAD